ncbi:DUF5060 domain-containing protein [Candidatus Roizmanbacteria bacterium]|nr:MAG: DUF5060 domain-containing protein [Candidatus Roizmanbacteria bacterium]
MLNKNLIYALILAFTLTFTMKVEAAAPSINSASQPQGTLQKFSKLEWDLSVNKEYPNPFYYYDASDTPQSNPSNMTWYGVDGVSVDMVIAEPGSSNSFKVPGFYYQEYKRVLVDGQEVLGKVGSPTWKVRYTPSKTGTYIYYFTVQDKEGTARYPQTGTLSFAVGDSNSDGFVRTSTKDSRFMAYDSGRPYVPIGAGSQWYPDREKKSFSYDDLFKTYGDNGVNFLRIWDEFDFALGVEGAQTVWKTQNDPNLAARGVEIKTTNVRNGLRSARPANGDPWYQRVAISEPNTTHRLTAWVKYSGLSGTGARIYVKTGALFTSGQILAQSQVFSGTQSNCNRLRLTLCRKPKLFH